MTIEYCSVNATSLVRVSSCPHLTARTGDALGDCSRLPLWERPDGLRLVEQRTVRSDLLCQLAVRRLP